MAKKAQSLLGALVLICIVVIAAAVVLGLSRPTAPFGAAAQPAATDTPLPPLPLPTFHVLIYETSTPPPPPPSAPTLTPIPIETLEYLQSLPLVTPGTPLPGTPVAPLPTLDPTAESILATASAITPSPYPTRIRVTPDGTWRSYIDPNLGFSLIYPANWFLDGVYIKPDFQIGVGYSIAILNHDQKYVKDDEGREDEIKIQVMIQPFDIKSLAASNLQAQIEYDANQAGAKISDLTPISIADTQGFRWIEHSERLPKGTVAYAFNNERQDAVYYLYAFPATSKYIDVFDKIALSVTTIPVTVTVAPSSAADTQAEEQSIAPAGPTTDSQAVSSPLATPAPDEGEPVPTFEPIPTTELTTGYLTCTRHGADYHCQDGVLHLQFAYPASWGEARSTLGRSTYDQAFDYSYGMAFSAKPNLLAGGVGQWNGVTGRDGGPTEFAGGQQFIGAKDACRYAGEYICVEVQADVLLTLHLPDAGHVCRGPGLDYDYPPVARLMIDLQQRNDKIGGFLFMLPFLSESALRELNGILDGKVGWPARCDDASRQAFDAKRREIMAAIRNGTADAGTMSNLCDLNRVAASIQFASPQLQRG